MFLSNLNHKLFRLFHILFMEYSFVLVCIKNFTNCFNNTESFTLYLSIISLYSITSKYSCNVFIFISSLKSTSSGNHHHFIYSFCKFRTLALSFVVYIFKFSHLNQRYSSKDSGNNS